jgi:hypothetical protein
VTEPDGGSPTLAWAGLGLLGTIWVVAHWRIAAFLDDLDGTWDPPSFLEPIERLFLLVVGVAASLLLVTGVQWLFRRALARRLAGVDPRRQVLLFVVPVLVCLLASWRFRVMLVGPALLLALNAVQLVRGLPPSTPATEAFGWFGRTGSKVGKAGWRLAGKGARAARERRAKDDRAKDDSAPPF